MGNVIFFHVTCHNQIIDLVYLLCSWCTTERFRMKRINYFSGMRAYCNVSHSQQTRLTNLSESESDILFANA